MTMIPIIRVLKKKERFLISTHVNPDPDALCSELALAHYLRSIGKKVAIVNQEAVPKRFHFLPGIKSVQVYRKNKIKDYDAAIVVDCGELDRIGKVQELILKDKRLINIDHHITNTRFGHLNLVNPVASSTAELLYELLSKAKCRLTTNLALNIYIGIMTDTGSFRYENTTTRTHAIVAELMKCPISADVVYRKLYETISFRDLKEFTKVISRFDIYCGGKVVFVKLSKKVVSRFSGDFDLRDAIFKFLRSMKTVAVIAVLSEVGSHQTRVNLRSSNQFNVAKLAGYFQGGGHKRASGCTVQKSMQKTEQAVLKKIRLSL